MDERNQDVWPGAFELRSHVIHETSSEADRKQAPPPVPPPQPQVIELTSKKWKARQAVGFLVAVIFLFLAFLLTATAPVLAFFSIVACLVGLCYYLYARVGAWWEHG